MHQFHGELVAWSNALRRVSEAERAFHQKVSSLDPSLFPSQEEADELTALRHDATASLRAALEEMSRSCIAIQWGGIR